MRRITFSQSILPAYKTTTHATYALWQAHPSVGDAVAYPDDMRKLCISSGRTFAATGALAELHKELMSLAANDATLDIVPMTSLHFSFLAMSWGLFNEPSEAPPLQDIAALFAAHTTHIPFVISQLRVVPLRNSLILAGLPDVRSFDARQALAKALLQSTWRAHIEARYAGYEIPPLFWHTTLARANTQFAPNTLRELYHAYRSRTFDDLELSAPQLALVNYNWSRRFIISS